MTDEREKPPVYSHGQILSQTNDLATGMTDLSTRAVIITLHLGEPQNVKEVDHRLTGTLVPISRQVNDAILITSATDDPAFLKMITERTQHYFKMNPESKNTLTIVHICLGRRKFNYLSGNRDSLLLLLKQEKDARVEIFIGMASEATLKNARQSEHVQVEKSRCSMQ